MAQTTLKTGKLKEAERLDRQLIEKTAVSFGVGEVTMAARVLLGATLLREGQYDEALDNLTTAEDWFTRNVGQNDLTAITAMQYLAMASAAQSRWNEALRWRSMALRSIEIVAGGESREAVDAEVLLARDDMHAGRLNDALLEARKSLATAESTLPNDSPTTIAARVTISQILLRKGDDSGAEVAELMTPVRPVTTISDATMKGLIYFLSAERAKNSGATQQARDYARQAQELMLNDAPASDQAELHSFIATLG